MHGEALCSRLDEDTWLLEDWRPDMKAALVELFSVDYATATLWFYVATSSSIQNSAGKRTIVGFRFDGTWHLVPQKVVPQTSAEERMDAARIML